MTVLSPQAELLLGELRLFGDSDHNEHFARSAGLITRTSCRRDGLQTSCSVPDLDDAPDLESSYERSWLRMKQKPHVDTVAAKVRVADLFSGVGGLSTGAFEACRSLGLCPEFVFAAEMDRSMLDRYSANFDSGVAHGAPIEDALDGELGSPPTMNERRLRRDVGQVDLLLAGPPCQGHSDLNNHTRRNDDRNALYLRTARFIELFEPDYVLIENVRGVIHDKSRVVQRTRALLESLGYAVDGALVRAEDVGVPQRRRRYFLVASRQHTPSVMQAVRSGARSPRPVMWAIEDLGTTSDGIAFESSASHSAENRRRIDYLFDHELYELPDSQRPACHRDKTHTYKSVYGRMRPDEPAPTITVGFGSTGQGRFVHPLHRRTLTPHEAARVQTFPDWFDFSGLRRSELQKAIGNAVPPLMAATVIRHLLA